jgi:hypothetical protein
VLDKNKIMIKNVLLVVLFIVVFGTGFLIGRFTPVANTVISGAQSPSAEVTDMATEQGASSDTGEGNVSVEASNLTDGQKQLLSALGIDADSITVTPEMIACAETSLGDARVVEITNGATPSFTEGLKLAACYK